MGMFGSRFRPDPLPAAAPLGLTGQIPLGGAAQTAPVRPGFDDVGGMHDKLRALAASLRSAGGNQAGANAIQSVIDDRQKQFSDWQERVELARIKASLPQEEPSVIRTLRAIGIDPTSPQGQQVAKDSLTRPFWLGNAEAGFTNPAAMGGMTAAGAAGAETQVINGKTYYKVNGDWYDNPEGR